MEQKKNDLELDENCADLKTEMGAREDKVLSRVSGPLEMRK